MRIFEFFQRTKKKRNKDKIVKFFAFCKLWRA